MNISKRIISFVGALSMFFVFSVSAFAENLPGESSTGDTNISLVNYGDLLAHMLDLGRDDVNYAGNVLRSYVQSDYCPASENHRHNFVAQHTQVGKETGNYYVCEYCRKTAGEVCADSYNNMVSEMPFTGIDSNGGFLWYPTFDDVSFYSVKFGTSIELTKFPNDVYSYGYRLSVDKLDNRSIKLIYKNESSNYNSSVASTIVFNCSFISPFSCSLATMASDIGFVEYVSKKGMVKDSQLLISGGSFAHCDKGATLSKQYSINSGYSDDLGALCVATASLFLPVFRIIPDSVPSGDTYSIDYRPTAIYAPVSYVDNSGQTQVCGDVKLFSENDMTLTNPQTGTTSTVTDWSYDYSTRTYDLTLDSGDHSTVTYGDKNITIKQGDNVYTYNYYIQNTNDIPSNPDNPSNPDDPDTPTTDDYRHDWVLNEDSTIWHDADGNQIPPEFVEYTCSKCHLICRCHTGESPPEFGCGGGGSGGGLIDPNTGELIPSGDTETGLALLKDKLLNLWNSLSESFGQLPQFYAAAAPIIPPEILQLMEWAVVVGLLVGVWRLLKR